VLSELARQRSGERHDAALAVPEPTSMILP
jgi:hypothetical protein